MFGNVPRYLNKFRAILQGVRVCYTESYGALAERLRRGLQNLLDEFDSRTCLHFIEGILPSVCFEMNSKTTLHPLKLDLRLVNSKSASLRTF